jgi:type II secretory pathway pseudopilin PulG
MKKQAGFTMVEFLVAMAVTIVALTAAVAAFMDTMRTNDRVSLTTDLNDNLRAAMNQVRQDIVLAGEGIPVGGIQIPSGPGVSIKRPNLSTLPLTFLGTNLPAVTLGSGKGPPIQLLVSPSDPPPATATPTDVITLLYQDNTWTSGVNAIDSSPITRLATGTTPACNGSISPLGDSVSFDTNCVNLSSAKVPIRPGDLIYFTDPNNQTAIQTVTSVNGQTVNFAADATVDKFGFNGTGAPAGTILQLRNSDNSWPIITATRVWMISYYLDNVTDSQAIRLDRQVNFNPPQPVAEVIENLQIRYNFVDGATPPTFFPNQSLVPATLTEQNIRSVSIFLGARSGKALLLPGSKPLYLRNNMRTQISLRSLSYFDKYTK